MLLKISYVRLQVAEYSVQSKMSMSVLMYLSAFLVQLREGLEDVRYTSSSQPQSQSCRVSQAPGQARCSSFTAIKVRSRAWANWAYAGMPRNSTSVVRHRY